MRHDTTREKYRKIIDDAMDALPRSRSESTNMYLDVQAHREGALVGPAPQKITAKQSALVVFVDENPQANFSHECRYRFYDPRTQRFLYEVRAQFPPWVRYVPKTYRAIYEPVKRKTRDAEVPHE